MNSKVQLIKDISSKPKSSQLGVIIKNVAPQQNHTGCNFKDIDDLRDQYYTFLEEYDRWSFLP